MSGTSAGEEPSLSLASVAALLHLFIDIELLSAHQDNFNGHEVQFRGFSLVGEKIDPSFPAGFHTLLLGNARQSDMIEFQSKVWLQKRSICWLDIHSVHVRCHVAAAAGLYMPTLSTLAHSTHWHM